MENYIIGIGKRIKSIRKEQGKTISIISSKAAVTNGLISRIENGRTIPSLPVLLKIIDALEVEVTDFFNGIPKVNGSNFIITRREDISIIEKEDDAKGFIYNYIFGKQFSSLGFEAILLEVQPNSKREKVVTDAFEFKYMISGECFYVFDKEEVLLNEGDAIFFDGRVPHVPVNKSKESCKMLVLYFFF